MYKKIVYFFSLVCGLICLSFQIKKENKELQFFIKPSFGNQNLVLKSAKYITEKNDTLSITSFRFYISNVVLEYSNGTIYKEPESVHLIDAEEENTLQFHLKNTPDLKLKNIRFNIGIDSVTNVSGNLEGDLDPSLGMYWAWNSGYINMKLEGKSSSCKTIKKDFQFHIGGYLPNQNALQQVSLTVPNESNLIKLKFDLSKWLNEISLKETSSIMIPGDRAIKMSNFYKKIVAIEKT